MSEHEQTLDLLARILTAIEKQHDATLQLAESLAGVRQQVKAARVETDKVIEKAAAPAPKTDAVIPASPSATYEDAKKAMMALPRDKAVAMLKGMGVQRLSDLPAEKFADVIEACRHG